MRRRSLNKPHFLVLRCVGAQEQLQQNAQGADVERDRAQFNAYSGAREALSGVGDWSDESRLGGG